MAPIKNSKTLLLLSLLILAMTSCVKEDPTPAPTIYLTATEHEIDVDSTLKISPKITYDYHSTYQWVLDGETVATTKDYSVSQKTPKTLTFTFTVKTPSGTDSKTITVQAMHVLDFESYKLAKDTADYGQGGTLAFDYKGATFPVTYGASGVAWDGFALSRGTIKTQTNSKIKYSAYPGYGSGQSKHFMVYHQPISGDPIYVQFAAGVNRTVKSVDVTNTSYLYYVIKSGMDVSAKFGEGKTDWYLLTVVGYDASNNKTGEKTFYLADYRDNVKTKRYMVETWTKVSLADLGAVNKIAFVLTSSDSDANGMNTPGYFCIDNLKIVD